jgi:hypothetical protein
MSLAPRLTVRSMYGPDGWRNALDLPLPSNPNPILLQFARFKFLGAFEAHLEDPNSTGHSLQPLIEKLHLITMALEQGE